VRGAKLRMVMSSIMRWRSGLTRVSAMGASCLEVRLDTPILGQDALARDHAPAATYRGSGLVQWP